MKISVAEEKKSVQRTVVADSESDNTRYTIAVEEEDGAIIKARAAVTEEITEEDGSTASRYLGTVLWANSAFSTQQLSMSEAAAHIAVVAQILEELQKGEGEQS